MSEGSELQQVVLVTGVTSGVGRALAVELVSRGSHVVGTGRRASLGEEFVAEMAGAPGELSFVAGDVKSPADCERFVRAAVDRYGRLDVLINNAGTVGNPALFDSHRAPEEWWDDIVDTNLKGVFFCSQSALNAMLPKRKGLIVNISSTNVSVPIARMQAYNASKAAVLQLGRGLAVEYQASGVRVNNIVLGAVGGDTGAKAARAIKAHMTGDPDYTRDDLGRRIAQSNRQIARFLAGLTGPDFATLTGATVALDRGVSAGLLGSLAMYMSVAGEWHIPAEDP